MTSTLQELLNEHCTTKYFIEYEGFLSNHLSHGLIALDRLGSNPDRLQRFIKWYCPKLETPEYDVTSDCEDVDKLTGKRVSFYSILQHYETLYHDKYHDLDKLIAGEFPKLSAGLAGSAVHGMVHLGYGYAARNERVVLEGLAYLHHSSQPIVSNVTGSPGKGDTEILDILSAVSKDDKLPQAVLIGMDKDEYTTRKVGSFQRKVGYLVTEQGDMLVSGVLSIKLPPEVFTPGGGINVSKLAHTIVKWAILVYTVSERKNDFFLLHGVTCAWAVMQVCSVLKEADALLAIQQYLAVLVAVYIAQEAPALTVPLVKDRTVTDEDWTKLVERTLADDRDEHCYKLVQVCYEMARGDPTEAAMYMQAAESTLENEFIF